MNRTTKLAIILIGLILISLGLAFYDGSNSHRFVDTDVFQVKDTSAIQSITIKGSKFSNKIQKSEGEWVLNDEFKIDQSLIKIVKNILVQVVVKRPVSKISNEEIISELKSSGYLVAVEMENGEELRFYAGGDTGKTKAYFLEEGSDRANLVGIPGYQNYLSGIFELTTYQWRDRLLFASNWRTIQLLNFDYSSEGQSDLDIKFDGTFLAVSGVNKLDTGRMMSYIQQYEYFQINDFLEAGRYPKYDSIGKTVPMVRIELRDIDKTKSRVLEVFPLIKGEKFYLIKDEKAQMMVIDAARVANLMASPGDFIYQ